MLEQERQVEFGLGNGASHNELSHACDETWELLSLPAPISLARLIIISVLYCLLVV